MPIANGKIDLVKDSAFLEAAIQFVNFDNYLAARPDVGDFITNKLKFDVSTTEGKKAIVAHFLNYGAREGVVVSPNFDGAYYLQVHADVKAFIEEKINKNNLSSPEFNEANAFIHAVEFLPKEGRKPAPNAAPGVNAAGVNVSGGKIFGEGGLPSEPPFEVTGLTIQLRANGAVTTGTDKNDLFTGTHTTLLAGDIVDGKGGTDKMLISMGGNSGAATVKNVEYIEANVTAAATMDMSLFTGVKSVISKNSVETLTLSNINEALTVGIDNLGIAKNLVAGFTASATGSDKTVTVSLSKVGTNDGDGTNDPVVTINAASGNFGTVAIQSKGTQTNYLQTLDGTGIDGSATKLTVSGTQKLKIADDIAATFTNIDASGSSGGVDIGVATGGDLTFKGSTANDRISVKGFNSSDSIDGNGGTHNILAVNAAIASAPANISNIHGVEFTQNNATQDASKVGNSVKDLYFSGGGTISVTSIANDMTVHVPVSATSVALDNAAGSSDSANLVIKPSTSTGVTITTLDSGTGALTTLNLYNHKADHSQNNATSIPTLTHTAGGTINLAGDNNISIGTTAMTNAGITIDGRSTNGIGEFTGDLTIVGTSGVDTIKRGSAGKLTFTTGHSVANTDVITGTFNANDKFNISIATINGTAGVADLTKGDATNVAAGAVQIGSFASGDAYLANGNDSIFKVTNTTGLGTWNSATILSNGITVAGNDPTDAYMVMHYDANAGKMRLGYVLDTAGDNVLGPTDTTYAELMNVEMTGAQYTALTAANFEFVA